MYAQLLLATLIFSAYTQPLVARPHPHLTPASNAQSDDLLDPGRTIRRGGGCWWLWLLSGRELCG